MGQVGHRRVLLTLLVCEMASLVALFVLPPSALSGLPFAASELLAIEYVYRDAKAINGARGFKASNATLWSLLSLCLSFVGLGLYVFVERPTALSPQGQLTVRRRPIRKRAIYFLIAGAYLLLAGHNFLVGAYVNLGLSGNLAVGSAVILVGAVLLLTVVREFRSSATAIAAPEQPVGQTPRFASAPERFCSDCGAPTQEGVTFCGSCGARLLTTSADQTSIIAEKTATKRPPYYLILFLAAIGIALAALGVSALLDVGFIAGPTPLYAQNGTITGYAPPLDSATRSFVGAIFVIIGLIFAGAGALIVMLTRAKKTN